MSTLTSDFSTSRASASGRLCRIEVVGDDSSGGLEREAADEDCETVQYQALGLGQQAMAPIQGGGQRLMPRRGCAPAMEQIETDGRAAKRCL